MKSWTLHDFINSKQTESITINVGGRIHKFKWSVIRKYQNSRLDRLYKALTHDEVMLVCDEYNLHTNEYFFDRHPRYFEMIWNILKSGQFYFENEYCISTFLEELHYWGYPLKKNMARCCQYGYSKDKESRDEELEKVTNIMKQLEKAEVKENDSRLGQFKTKLWNTMEHPKTSILSRIIATLSVFFILLSTICLIVSTLQIFNPRGTHNRSQISPSAPTSLYNNTTSPIPSTNTLTPEQQYQHDVHVMFDVIEYVCISWFTIEYVLRLFSAANRTRFFMYFVNVIDFISIAPFYFTLILNWVLQDPSNIRMFNVVSRVVQVFRILRILRVLKLARHSVGLQSLGYTLHKSYKELGLLLSFIIMGVYLFSSVVYFAERHSNPEMFPSIPGSFWWAVISITTVGYGDVYPITELGQIFASICCVSGVLVVGLPIPIIVSNFSEFYKDKVRLEKSRMNTDELHALSCQQATGNLITSFAQHTLSFFHAFNRAPQILSDDDISRSRSLRGENGLQGKEVYMNEDEYGIVYGQDRELGNRMDLLLNTECWKYIDSSTSDSSSMVETDEEEI